MIKKMLDRMALYLGVFLLFGIMLFPEIRDQLGKVVGLFFITPLLSAIPLHMIIFILAAITGLYASLIQKYTMDWGLMKSVQEKTRNLQKEMREAQLSNNPQKMKKLQSQQAEMMADQMEIMKQQFKPMLYISIISIPLFLGAWFVISQYPDISMVFPFWGELKLHDNLFGLVPSWLFWYFLCSIPVSQMTRKALNIGGI
ncbi:MAG TPA: EMC3/TMCO1 family protein [Candidatus Methanoperedens sp.]|nr:EMC3/TMCO1 family protein [Candidatus Methanoperedens sp.]